MKLFKKQSGLLANRNRWGYAFCAHWILGLAMFFVIPTITSIYYAFSTVNVGAGMATEFVGFQNFIEIFKTDRDYTDNLAASLTDLVTSLPIIISLSMVLALILNSKFKGRVVFRAIFFLPVIIAGSVIMEMLTGAQVNAPLFTVTSGEEASVYGGSLIDFNSLLTDLNLPEAINKLFSEYLGSVFNLIWSCGIQTILFLAGLQSISAQLYEVGKIEGANRWEMFWFVEIPMMRNIIMLVLLYTMMDLITAITTPVMDQVSGLMFENSIYDKSSAMLWIYFLIAGAIMALILFVYNRFCMKRWE